MTKTTDMTRDQRRALLHIQRGKNVLITGGAGTGKSFLLSQAVQILQDSGKTVAICAPTGKAALDIGGITVHSLFGFPAGPCIQIDQSGPHILVRNSALLNKADVLVIDEFSLLRMDYFDAAVLAIRRAEKERGKPIQLILCGDPFQLPPVMTPLDAQILKSFYGDGLGNGYAFKGLYWNECSFYTVVLYETVRQRDPAFIECLEKIRMGDASGIVYLNSHVPILKDRPDALCLYAWNKAVNKTNMERLNALKTPPWFFETTLVFDEGYCQDNVDSRLLDVVPPTLVLKEGARVMFTVNDYPGNRSVRRIGTSLKAEDRPLYVNGMLGTVTAIRSNKSVTVCTDSGTLLETQPVSVRLYSYEIDGAKLVKKRVATYHALPLRLAYSSTFHKCQGSTLLKVHIDPDNFMPGHLYVGLTRCPHPSGLSFSRFLREEDIRTDPDVLEFYSSLVKGNGRTSAMRGPAKDMLVYVPVPLIEHVRKEIQLSRPIGLTNLPPHKQGRRHMRVPSSLYEHIVEEVKTWKEAVRKKGKKEAANGQDS